MPESENLRMINLLKKLRMDILSIEEVRNARLIKEVGADIQQVYKLHLSAKQTFTEVEFYLKSLYKSYNFAAAVVSEALKTKTPISEVNQLEECFEVMINCCDVINSKLKKKK